jgi:hypothetical protein
VTAPDRASARPFSRAPVCNAIDASAMIVPTNLVPVPRVAELETCQNTLQADAPLMNTTLLFDAVTRVELIWKMNTDRGSLRALRVSRPVN